jgi:hypothetical protein
MSEDLSQVRISIFHLLLEITHRCRVAVVVHAHRTGNFDVTADFDRMRVAVGFFSLGSQRKLFGFTDRPFYRDL